jgi:hypothetical protein
MGRLLLWAAYAANIAVAIALYVVLSPLFSAVVTQAQYNAAAVTQEAYALLTVVPALLFTGADYLVWSRIKRGEIPAPPPMIPPTGVAPPMNPR